MAKSTSLIANIISRKIPHIIGMYIASVWLVVEISDWMSSRFDLPEQFATYVFVGMLSFLPSIILVAWGHGKPGKDKWTNLEKSWIPINIILAVYAVGYLVKPIPHTPLLENTPKVSQLATQGLEKLSIVDAETGNQVTYEVAKQDFHQSVIAYFWDNNTQDESLDWLSYGASWLLAQDLKRTPLISVQTPYDSGSVYSQLVAKGFESALNVPLSLARKIAENKSAKWFVQGSFEKILDKIQFTAHLYDTQTGKEMKTITAINENWLTALDVVSDEVSEVILNSAKVIKNIIPQLAIADHTSNNIEAIQYLITAKNSITFDNDFNTAIESLLKALELDASFADANVLAMVNYIASGDIANAIVQSKKALELDYKLYKESEFLVKANLFALQGQQDKTLKILENWVKIYPNSVDALEILASNYVQIGHHQSQATEIYKKLYKIEGVGSKYLINLGKIYRLQNDKENALDVLEKYKQANITKSNAYFNLAAAYKQFGMLVEAKEMYEEASLHDNKDFKAEIGIAGLVAASGDYKEAIVQLTSILEKSKTDGQKLTILSTIIEIYLYTGQIHQALGLHDEMVEYGTKVLPPIGAIFQIQGMQIYLYALIGEYEQAKNKVKELAKELKPPYDSLLGALEKTIYENNHDIKKFEQALQDVEKFVETFNIAAMKPDIYKSKGQLAYWQDDYAGATKLFEQALTESKQSFVTLITTRQIDELRYNNAEALIGLEKHQQAIENLDIILTRTPLYAKAHYLKAKAYHKMGKVEKVKDALAQAHTIWQDADADYIDYQKLLAFEKTIEVVN